jgi:DNA-binding transcriptional MerR regulator
MIQNANTRPLGLTIGKLGSATDTSVETIRYYERIGLMPAPPRTPAGYRLYDDDSVRRLAFIRRARQLEFSLNETAELLKHRDGKAVCDRVQELATHKMDQLEAEARRLTSARGRIQQMAEQCEPGRSHDACEFVTALDAPLKLTLV